MFYDSVFVNLTNIDKIDMRRCAEKNLKNSRTTDFPTPAINNTIKSVVHLSRDPNTHASGDYFSEKNSRYPHAVKYNLQSVTETENESCTRAPKCRSSSWKVIVLLARCVRHAGFYGGPRSWFIAEVAGAVKTLLAAVTASSPPAARPVSISDS